MTTSDKVHIILLTIFILFLFLAIVLNLKTQEIWVKQNLQGNEVQVTADISEKIWVWDFYAVQEEISKKVLNITYNNDKSIPDLEREIKEVLNVKIFNGEIKVEQVNITPN